MKLRYAFLGSLLALAVILFTGCQKQMADKMVNADEMSAANGPAMDRAMSLTFYTGYGTMDQAMVTSVEEGTEVTIVCELTDDYGDCGKGEFQQLQWVQTVMDNPETMEDESYWEWKYVAIAPEMYFQPDGTIMYTLTTALATDEVKNDFRVVYAPAKGEPGGCNPKIKVNGGPSEPALLAVTPMVP